MTSHLEKTGNGARDVQIKTLPKVGITLAFNLPPAFDLDAFENECKKTNLPVQIEKGHDIPGTVFVACKSFDIENNLDDIREKLSGPIKSAIQSIRLQEKIKAAIIKTRYFDSVVKYLQNRWKEYKANRVTKEQVQCEVYLKYGHLLGKEGAIRVADLFNKNTARIIDKYVTLQEYLLKHYAIEFFIYLQVKKNYYLIITVRENGEPLLGYNEINLSENRTLYEKKAITLPGLSKIDNNYISPQDKNSILIVNPNNTNYRFINKMLQLKQVNSDILFMDFMMNKHKELLKVDLEQFGIVANQLQSEILRFNSKSIELTLNKIEQFEAIVFNLQNEFVFPVKKYCDEINLEKRQIETETLRNIFYEKKKAGGEEIGVEKFNPPNWLRTYFFVEAYQNFRNNTYLFYNSIDLLLLKIKELKEHLIEYKHKVEIREQEKAEKTRQMILNLANDIAKIMRTIFLPK